MIRKAARTRLMASSVGMLFQIVTIFFIIRFLDIYQFALWGVANSLIYIFSIVGQLAYSQFIEKYFQGLKKIKRIQFINKFLKTAILALPVWIGILYLLEGFNYFVKFNANNLYIFFVLIAITSVVESCLNIFHSYLLIEKDTVTFDKNELIFGKILKLILFYFILFNNLSIYFLLLGNLISRSTLLISLLVHKKLLRKENLSNLLKTSIFEENFVNFRYNFIAFLDKILYVSFINILFLYSVNFVENITISHFSIAILIVNNLRPVVDSISSLMPPIISKNVAIKTSSNLIKHKTLRINSYLFSLIAFVALIFTKYKFIINYFLENYDEGVYKIIFVAVVSSSLHALYYPNYLENLYSNKQNLLILFTILNQAFFLFVYSLTTNTFINNFLYIFIGYELINIFLHFYLNNRNNSFIKIIKIATKPLCSSFFLTIVFVALYFNNFNSSLSFFYLIIPITIDTFLINKEFDMYQLLFRSNKKNEENK